MPNPPPITKLHTQPSISMASLPSPAGRYIPCYQPIVDTSTGRVAGYESLARIRTSEGQLRTAAGLFTSGRYAPSAVLRIDRDLRQQALNTFAQHPDVGFLALNICPHWVDRLDQNELIPTLGLIESSGIDPARVIVEITERAGDIDNLRRLTREYQKQGIRVAIDDFGSGASQIDRIAALKPDVIKLDMGLLKAAVHGGIEADIALSITEMSKRIGCQVICEGIETEQEYQFALECGADLIQGWIYGKASESLMAPSDTVNKTRNLKTRYLNRKARVFSEARIQQEAVGRQLQRVAAQRPEQQVLPASLLSELNRLGVIRYYICDHDGNQVSPNIEIATGETLEEFVGKNWSHRPYFPQMIGMGEQRSTQMVVSNPYRDSTSGIRCKTFGISLSNRQFLLADVDVSGQL